jgi:hypothetical protein
MRLMEQSGPGDDLGLGAILVNQLGDMAQEIFHRHPRAGSETGIQMGVLAFEPSLPAALLPLFIVSTDGHGRIHPEDRIRKTSG